MMGVILVEGFWRCMGSRHVHIQILPTDNCGEFFRTMLGDWQRANGIVHQSSHKDTPQQSRIAERKKKHLLHSYISYDHH